jgi:hypothetical protein
MYFVFYAFFCMIFCPLVLPHLPVSTFSLFCF